MKALKAAHPGQILREEFIEALGLTIYGVAKASGIPQSSLSQIVNGKRGITVDTALRLGQYFGTSAEFWSNLQLDYDMRIARRELSRELPKVHPLALKLPKLAHV